MEVLLILRMGGDQIIYETYMLLKLFISNLQSLSMDFKYYTWAILLLFCLSATALAEQCVDSDEEFYISFHPHLDAFWLNTDEQLKNINFRPQGFLYMMNQRNAKQIFNSMLSGLTTSPQRKYFVTEAVFLKDWYEYLPNASKQKVKQFIKNGQLQITNGGWVQNDEAVCYIDDVIDQYTIGHNWLYQQFGEIVKIAWATDSFGHSHSQAAIEHILGIQIQGIQRIDDRYIYQRKGGSLLQFYWSAVSDSNGLKYGGVFTYIRHFLHEFINYRQMSPSWIANDHQRMITSMKKMFKGNKFFRFVGNDFEEFNEEDFSKMDQAFEEMNKNKRTCSVYKWGNPSDYFKWIKSYKEDLIQVRQSDFLPNYDQDHYWSGYYTSNPQLKIVCKDFSRLVNLYRKLYIKNRIKGGQENTALLQKMDELVSVMQHHDGITATSKYHIEQKFRNQMVGGMKQMGQAIKKFNKNSDAIECSLYVGGLRCDLPINMEEGKTLKILHQGAPKSQKIQLRLPEQQIYEVAQDEQASIFCKMDGKCTLVFEANLQPGQNFFTLESSNPESLAIVKQVQAGSLFYQTKTFSTQVNKNTLKYSLKNGQFIMLSLVTSPNEPSSTSTRTWNKFGQPINKSERRSAGIYIMSNTGRIQEIREAHFEALRVSQGKKYVKISVSSKIINFEVTINKNSAELVNIQATFAPLSMRTMDYFIKIDSSLKTNDVFYHDVSGYLVSKRKIGTRLDYDWTYKKQDKINANNYPMCSFAYILDNNKKLVVFTDRAQGFTTYDNSLLINIDRLTYDDYKGVGQGYMRMINNTFKFKVGMVQSHNHIERIWQRQYDQANIGFIQDSTPESPPTNSPTAENTLQMLKYTVFSLNKNQFVIRLFNMGEKNVLKVPKFENNVWRIHDVGIDYTFTDIRQSFANGIPLAQRKIWKSIPGQVNIFSAGSKDTSSEIHLEPLQIRSFRINMHEKIKGHALKTDSQKLADVQITEVKPLKNPFMKRCF